MKAQIEFKVEGIEWIQFRPVKKLNFIYHFHIPKKNGFRHLFSYKREFKGVWTDGDNMPYYSNYDLCWKGYYSSNNLKSMGYFQTEEGRDNPWFKKAVVTVQTCKHEHRACFKTNEEAKIFIQRVKDLSGETMISYNL